MEVYKNGKFDYTEFIAATLQKKNYLKMKAKKNGKQIKQIMK